jgi:hypothetical protein
LYSASNAAVIQARSELQQGKKAATAMVTKGQLNWAEQNGYYHLVPVRKHIAKATVVEVFRLKYRPYTIPTAAWYAQMQQTAAEYLECYRAMIKETHDAISRINQR